MFIIPSPSLDSRRSTGWTGKSLAWAVAWLLAACGSAPPPPDWQNDAFAALNAHASAYLEGNDKVADAAWVRAQAALVSTGRPDLMARAALRVCAIHTASLALGPCSGYASWAADAAPAERAYAAFIRGDLTGLKAEQLPQPYRALWTSMATTVTSPDTDRLSAIADPLSRLIAAAVLLQQKQITPAERTVAVDTASAQGWRRPLLAWLWVQRRQAEQTGDPGAAAAIQRRMDLMVQTPNGR